MANLVADGLSMGVGNYLGIRAREDVERDRRRRAGRSPGVGRGGSPEESARRGRR